jgi:hypothetical protein
VSLVPEDILERSRAVAAATAVRYMAGAQAPAPGDGEEAAAEQDAAPVRKLNIDAGFF